MHTLPNSIVSHSKHAAPPHVQYSRELLLNNFLADSRPWVVAYSGGKDSTLVLQLVMEMLSGLPQEKLKPVHVISSDTGVEPPNIARYMHGNLERLALDSRRRKLGLTTHLVRPSAGNGFWVNLIGKGYPPPTRWFRWCTTKMKIKPSREVIDKITKDSGSVILLLGTRIGESHQRGQGMRFRESNNRGLNPHHQIPNALVLSPIADWSTDQVWEYLFHHNPPPWGGSHDEMMALYKQANSGECPLVMDLNTPSCGGSRFGCWICTVVKTDKSMESFIDNGEKWMMPLNSFRNWLKKIREDENRRCCIRRSGEEGLGPFDSASRLEILEELFKTEKAVGMELISDEELIHIQQVWTEEFDVMRSALRLAARYNRLPMRKETLAA